MNQIVEKLKTKSMELRKARNPLATSLSFALSEIEKVGKNSGNRQTTEDEAIKVVQKLIATIEGNMNLKLDDSKYMSLKAERDLLKSVLPRMATEEELVSFLDQLDRETHKTKGDLMKAIKAKFGSLIDMKKVGTHVDAFLA
jgi:uncharacterized protein YqeY